MRLLLTMLPVSYSVMILTKYMKVSIANMIAYNFATPKLVYKVQRHLHMITSKRLLCERKAIKSYKYRDRDIAAKFIGYAITVELHLAYSYNSNSVLESLLNI